MELCRLKTETLRDSLKRHEHHLASAGTFKEGDKVCPLRVDLSGVAKSLPMVSSPCHVAPVACAQLQNTTPSQTFEPASLSFILLFVQFCSSSARGIIGRFKSN